MRGLDAGGVGVKIQVGMSRRIGFVVVRGQRARQLVNAVVDAPHLQNRMPAIFSGERT